jgi:hypothetical protein
LPTGPNANNFQRQPLHERNVPADGAAEIAEPGVEPGNNASFSFVGSGVVETELVHRSFPTFYVLKDNLSVYRESSSSSTIVRNLNAVGKYPYYTEWSHFTYLGIGNICVF